MAKADNNQAENSSKYTIDEAVILSSLYVVCIDGEIDDKEVNILKTHSFLGKYYTQELENKFVSLMKEEPTYDFIGMIRDDFKETFKNVDQNFKKEFINAISKIIIADGEVDKNEGFALTLIYTSLGLSGEEVNNIITEETQRMTSQNQGAGNAGCLGVFLVIGLGLYSLISYHN